MRDNCTKKIKQKLDRSHMGRQSQKYNILLKIIVMMFKANQVTLLLTIIIRKIVVKMIGKIDPLQKIISKGITKVEIRVQICSTNLKVKKVIISLREREIRTYMRRWKGHLKERIMN
jgi:hypothetical protein